jgi:hypothetical protein
MRNLALHNSSRHWWPLPNAARVLHLRCDSVARLIRTGQLVGYLSRPHWFIRGDSLVAYRDRSQRCT